MIKSIIVDDEIKSCEVLEKLIRQYCPEVEVVGIAHSAVEGSALIARLKPDLVFLDIQMPHGDGFTLLQQTQPANFKVIFVTAYDEFALKAIKFSALDYLLKPVRIDELIAAIKKINPEGKHALEQKKIDNLYKTLVRDRGQLNTIAISTMDEIQFIELDAIIRLEADSNYTRFYLQNGEKILTACTLKSYEEVLEDLNFMRIHNSHIINLRKVKKYLKGKGGHVVMADGSSVEVSPRKREELLSKLSI